MKLTDRVLLLIMIAVFLYSGIDKLFHYQGFIDALSDYVLVPRGMAPSLAAPVIAVEILLGIGLLVPGWRRASGLLGAGVMAFFTVMLVVNYWLGGRGICGCWFTLTLASSTEVHVVQNLIFVAMCLSIWWTSPRDAATSRDLALEQSSG